MLSFGTAFGGIWAVAEPLGGFGVVQLGSYGASAYLALGLLAGSIAFGFEFIRTRLRQVTVCQFNRTLCYLPLYVAQHHHFFTQHGLRVTIINGHGDEPVWRKVASGEAQFGISDPIGMIRDDLTAGVVVTTVIGRLAMWGMARKPIVQIRSMERFKNKKISVYKKPTTQYALMKKALNDAHVAITEHLFEHSPGSEMGSLLDEEIDIVLMDEPRATIAEREGAYRVFSAPKVIGPFLCTGCFTSKRFAESNSDVVQSFVNAMELAVRFIHADHIGALKVVHQEFADLDKTKAELATLRMLDDGIFPLSVVVDQVAWQAAVKTWFPDNWQEYDYEDYVDNQFALAASRT